MADDEPEVAAADEEPEIGAAADDLDDEDDDFVAVGGATEVKLFGKWSFDDIEIRDISLVVSVAGKQVVHTMRHLVSLFNLFFGSRITLPSREITLLTFPTLLDDTKRSDSVRPLAPSLSDWLVA